MSSVSPFNNNTFFTPSRALIEASEAEEAIRLSSANIDTGPEAGNVLADANSDFTDPNDILDDVDGFSDSVTPPTARSSAGASAANPLGVNPNATDILSLSNAGINNIFNSAGLPNSRDLPINFNPQFWRNPSPNQILLGTALTANSIIFGSGGFPSFPPTFGGGFPIQPPIFGGIQPFPVQPPIQMQLQPIFLQGWMAVPIAPPIPHSQPVPASPAPPSPLLDLMAQATSLMQILMDALLGNGNGGGDVHISTSGYPNAY